MTPASTRLVANEGVPQWAERLSKRRSLPLVEHEHRRHRVALVEPEVRLAQVILEVLDQEAARSVRIEPREAEAVRRSSEADIAVQKKVADMSLERAKLETAAR